MSRRRSKIPCKIRCEKVDLTLIAYQRYVKKQFFVMESISVISATI